MGKRDMNLLRTELDTAEIPEIYLRFADVIDEKHWKNRVSLLKSVIRGNRFLKDHLHAEIRSHSLLIGAEILSPKTVA